MLKNSENEVIKPKKTSRYIIISSFFYVGFIKWAPGTFGTAFAMVPAFFIQNLYKTYSYLYIWPLVLLIVIMLPIAYWCVEKSLEVTKTDDPSWIVIDEALGIWVALIFVEPNIFMYLAAFTLFRIFDISKLWIVGRAEKLKNKATAVILDDIYAGLLTMFCMFILWVFLG